MAKDKKAKEKKKPERKIVKKATKAKAKKKWLQLVAPKSFNNAVLGDTHVELPEKAIGKSITANLMNLSGDMRKQGTQIRFDCVNTEEGKANCAVTGYELLPGNLKRLIRRGRSKVADSFVVRNGTKRLIRIKPIIITQNRASRAACTALRLQTRERIKELVQQYSFDKMVQELINYKFQRAIKDTITKLYPIKSVEIKSCMLIPEGGAEKREISEDTRAEDFVEIKEPVAEEKPAEPAAE